MSHKPAPTSHTRSRSVGFSLVEVMVGLTVGLLAIIAVIQSLSLYDNQRRSTTAAADAQDNGLFGLTSIEQDMRNAAAGFNHPQALACITKYSFRQTGTAAPQAVAGFDPIPVRITAGTGLNGSDAIVIRSSARVIGAAPTMLKETMPSPSSPLKVERAFGIAVDDLLMVATPNSHPTPFCTLMRVTAVTDGGTTIAHDYESGQTEKFNPDASYIASNAWPPYPEQARVYVVGRVATGGIASTTYSIDANRRLQRQFDNGVAVSTNESAASEIVAMQAQYGVSATPSSLDITSWVSATGAWAAPTLTDTMRIKAVRITLVARSAKREGGLVTTAAPAGISLAASAGDTEWQHYRYRVYQTSVPMRNVMWAQL